MPDPLEHATGMERKELLAMQAGNDDPFNMKVLKKAAGTRDNPTLVPSCFDARIVGCICKYTVLVAVHFDIGCFKICFRV